MDEAGTAVAARADGCAMTHGGWSVVGESIRRIEEAEARAEETVRDARARGKKIIADAHEEAERLLEETRRRSREQERRLIEEAKSGAESEAERIVESSRGAVAEARAAGEARLASGVAKVLDFITAAG